MGRGLLQRATDARRRVVRAFGTDIETPRGRRGALWHYYLADVGFLRALWTNQYQIAPGVWRSNQPGPLRYARLARLGIRTILNLRGADRFSFYLFEKEACTRHGITLIDHKIYARKLVPPAQLAEIFAIFDQVQKPFLLHCKSGADRAGLVSALWLLDQEGASVAEAKRMLSLRFVHLKSTETGLMDAVIDAYEADIKDAPMPIRTWIQTRYDPAAITAAFYEQKGWKMPTPPADRPEHDR